MSCGRPVLSIIVVDMVLVNLCVIVGARGGRGVACGPRVCFRLWSAFCLLVCLTVVDECRTSYCVSQWCADIGFRGAIYVSRAPPVFYGLA